MRRSYQPPADRAAPVRREVAVATVLLLAMPLLAACVRDDPTAAVTVPPAASAPTVRGTVLAVATAGPVAGAIVSIGSTTTTTGSDGRFELSNLKPGPATLRCKATGFDDFEAAITVRSGSSTLDISLAADQTPPARHPTPLALHVSGSMGALRQSVRVRAGTPVTSAAVSVNGVAIKHCCGDLYAGNLREAAPAGSELHLEVSAGGLTVEGRGEVPDAPRIVTPATGSIVSSADSITVSWTSARDPDRFEVCLNCWENSLDGMIFTVPGTAREFRIAARDLSDYGAGAIVAVSAVWVKFLSFTGPVDAGSRVDFLSRAPEAVIRIAP